MSSLQDLVSESEYDEVVNAIAELPFMGTLFIPCHPVITRVVEDAISKTITHPVIVYVNVCEDAEVDLSILYFERNDSVRSRKTIILRSIK